MPYRFTNNATNAHRMIQLSALVTYRSENVYVTRVEQVLSSYGLRHLDFLRGSQGQKSFVPGIPMSMAGSALEVNMFGSVAFTSHVQRYDCKHLPCVNLTHRMECAISLPLLANAATDRPSHSLQLGSRFNTRRLFVVRNILCNKFIHTVRRRKGTVMLF